MKRIAVLIMTLVIAFSINAFAFDGPYGIFNAGGTETGTKYVVYLDTTIDQPSLYRGLLNFLEAVGEGDEVVFKLETNGGWLVTSLIIYNAILKCKAKTVADIHFAYSGGAMIAMACEEIRLNKFSRVMVHSAGWENAVFSGNVKDIKRIVDEFSDRSDDVTEGIFSGFITKSEMERVLKGEDLFLGGKVLEDRVKNWKRTNVKYRDIKKLKELKKANIDAAKKASGADLEAMLKEQKALDIMLKKLLDNREVEK